LHSHVGMRPVKRATCGGTLCLPRVEKDLSMNLRNIVKPIAAVLLTAGIVTAGVAPADAASSTPTYSTSDTGWGFK
jgi:hypothetical protein